MLIQQISKNIKAGALGVTVFAMAYMAPNISQKVLTNVGLDINTGALVYAQANERKPRRLPGIGQKINEQLNKVAEFISPSQEEGKPEKPRNLGAAEKLLFKMEKDCLKEKEPGKKACNGNELGNIYRFFGVLYFEKDEIRKTGVYFEKIIEQSPEIPLALEEQILLQLAQIWTGEGDYNKALKYIDKYISTVAIVSPDAYYTKSTICYQKDDLNCALTNINKAVKLKEDANLVPKETWYNLQRGIYNQKEDVKNSIVANIKLIKNYPKDNYWNDLGAFYSMLEQPKNSLYVLDAGYASNTLVSETQYLQLAQLYNQQEAPYNAAKILEEGIKKGIVDSNVKNLDRVGRYYYVARDYRKAILYLTKAGDKSDKGDLYADVAGLYVQIEEMDNAISMGKKALAKKGGLKKPGRLHFQIGSAYFEKKEFSKAIAEFEKSAKYKPTKKVAEQWLAYSKRQKQRYDRLEKFLNS